MKRSGKKDDQAMERYSAAQSRRKPKRNGPVASARESMIAWSPETDRIAVGPWPDRIGWSDGYDFTSGACESRWREASAERLAMLVMVTFHAIVVRDGVPALAAHQAFRSLREYADHIAPDIAGAMG